MKDEELKDIWRSGAIEITVDERALASTMQNQLDKFERDIRRRDRREILACAILIPFFGAMAIVVPQALARAGAAIGMLWAITCILVLRRTASARPTNIAVSYREYLVQMERYASSQQYLLNMVYLWYALPFTVSCSLIFSGFRWWSGVFITIGTGLVVIWINRRTAKNYFGPLVQGIRNELSTLDAEELAP